MKVRFSLPILLLLIAPVCHGRIAPALSPPPAVVSQSPVPLKACYGVRKPLTISSQMPYVLAQLGKAQGYFLIDFGSTFSSIDPEGFLNSAVPQPISGTVDRFTGFDFYGDWGKVRLPIYSFGHVRGTVRQAGIIGTDFLSNHVFTLDYRGGNLYRASSGQFCNDKVLLEEGFIPVTTRGYYEADTRRMRDGFALTPTVPVRIGKATANAQLDTGYDDAVHRHSVNINRALFEAVTAAGVKLEKLQSETWLSTCVANVKVRVIPYRITSGHAFEIIATDGSAAIAASDATLLLKETPAEAHRCGGIGTLAAPAAQVAASFFVDAGRIVFDPFTARVWFERRAN